MMSLQASLGLALASSSLSLQSTPHRYFDITTRICLRLCNAHHLSTHIGYLGWDTLSLSSLVIPRSFEQ